MPALFKFKYRNLLILLSVILIIIGYASLYQVNQNERALIFHFGKLTKNIEGNVEVVGPGLHIKWPLFSRVHKVTFARQILLVKSTPLNLAKHQSITLDYYLIWRVNDLGKYLVHFHAENKEAQHVLRNITDDELSKYYGAFNSKQVFAGRDAALNAAIKDKIVKKFLGFGIEVSDWQVIKLELAPARLANVLGNMQSQYRDEIKRIENGSTEMITRVKQRADDQAKKTLAQAELEATKIRADGESRAATLYEQAYKEYPEFYRLQKSLSIYKKTLTDKNDILLLQPGGELFRYLENR